MSGYYIHCIPFFYFILIYIYVINIIYYIVYNIKYLPRLNLTVNHHHLLLICNLKKYILTFNLILFYDIRQSNNMF